MQNRDFDCNTLPSALSYLANTVFPCKPCNSLQHPSFRSAIPCHKLLCHSTKSCNTLFGHPATPLQGWWAHVDEVKCVCSHATQLISIHTRCNKIESNKSTRVSKYLLQPRCTLKALNNCVVYKTLSLQTFMDLNL